MEKSDLNSKEEASHGDEFQELLQNLPKERDLISGRTLYFYQGFWVADYIAKSVTFMSIVALDDDLLLASCPKSGTTWLKAHSYSINKLKKNDIVNSV